MTTYSIALIAIIALSGFIGWRLGAIRIALLAAAPLAAGAVVPLVSVWVISKISFFDANPRFVTAASWIISLALIYLVAAIVTKIADALMIGLINRALGAAIFAAAALWLAPVVSRYISYPPDKIGKALYPSRILETADAFDKK